MSNSLAGHLLVATPMLRESTFEATVILLLSHDGDGALGVILNQATDVPVSRLLPAWGPLASEPDVIFNGGPVGRDSALALVRLGVGEEPLGVRRVHADVGVVDLDTPVEVVEEAVLGLRVFAGYAGWDSGQLESEIEEGSWYVVDAETTDAFRPDVETLWRLVLRRQGGDLALVSTFPDDPSLN